MDICKNAKKTAQENGNRDQNYFKGTTINITLVKYKVEDILLLGELMEKY